eukprot:gene7491-10206_t
MIEDIGILGQNENHDLVTDAIESDEDESDSNESKADGDELILPRVIDGINHSNSGSGKKKHPRNGGNPVTNINTVRKWRVAKLKKPNICVELEHLYGFQENATVEEYRKAIEFISCGKIICIVRGMLLTASKQTVYRHQTTNLDHMDRVRNGAFANLDKVLALDPNGNPAVEGQYLSKKKPRVSLGNVSQHLISIDNDMDHIGMTTSSYNNTTIDQYSDRRNVTIDMMGSFQNSNIASDVNGSVSTKRIDGVIEWDDYFMAISYLSAMRSKDPSTQVGACIVNADKRIVGIGYNGFPRGCSDDILPWTRHAENELDTKYPYVCHAEVNAILNKNSSDLKNCTIYVGLFPCNECAKMIIQSGITEVVYISDKYHDTPSMIASRRMFQLSRVDMRQHIPKMNSVVVDFTKINMAV